MPTEAIVAVAIAFAVVTGANDGGALIALGLRVPALSVLASVAMLTLAVVAYPLLISVAVAETTLNAIVQADSDGATALVIGFVVAVVVVATLAWASLPTSLTLAVIGGIAGSGFGNGLFVGWGTVLRVLAIGLAAPVVGALLALIGSWAWRSFRNAPYLSTVRRTHVAAFTAQCVAYGANDGQKVLVLFFVASIAAGRGPVLAWWVYPVVVLAFAAGVVAGLPKIAHSFGNGVLATRATHTVTAEFAAAAAVLGSAMVGVPVSMTQSIGGGLLGTGVQDSYRRIRWRVVLSLGLAWAVTLPASFGLGTAASFVMSTVTG